MKHLGIFAISIVMLEEHKEHVQPLLTNWYASCPFWLVRVPPNVIGVPCRKTG